MAKRKIEIGLEIEHDCYRSVTQEADSDDSWSRDSTAASWNVKGISLCANYPDITACFPVSRGDIVCLVYAVWSSGDSFGRDEDGNITFIDVFKSTEKAEECVDAIKQHNSWYAELNNRWTPMSAKKRRELKKKYDSEYTVEYKRENGETGDCHTSWHGYFESLSYVTQETFIVI